MHSGLGAGNIIMHILDFHANLQGNIKTLSPYFSKNKKGGYLRGRQSVRGEPMKPSGHVHSGS